MTDADYTHFLIVIDRSGSMANIKTQAQNGLNDFVTSNSAAPGRCRFTICQFDNDYEVVHDNVSGEQIPSFELRPRGMTALYDAIGRSFTDLGGLLAGMSEEERPGKVIVLIVTDGLENCSREFGAASVREIIERQTSQYQWEVTYLGANQDAVLTAGNMGIPMASSLTYAASPAGTSSAFTTATGAVLRSRSGGGLSYSDRERADAVDQDPTGIPDGGANVHPKTVRSHLKPAGKSAS